MDAGPVTAYRFDQFVLNLERGCLQRTGVDLGLRPKAFDVLRYLVEHAGKLASKNDLLDSVWPSVIVSDDSLAQCVREIRALIGDDDQRFIRTVPRRGYLFVADVTPITASASHPTNGAAAVTDRLSPGPAVGLPGNPPGPADMPPPAHSGARAGGGRRVGYARRSPLRMAALVAALGGSLLATGWLWPSMYGSERVTQSGVPRPLADQPSLAVLPFANLSSAPEQGFLTTGLTQDLTTALSRIPGLFATAYYPSQSAEGEAENPGHIAQQLGVKYVLTGSVRRAGDRLRVTTQLVDQTGTQVWSEYFDRPIENLFDTQDAIVKQVLIELQVKLTTGEGVRIANRSTVNFRAWLLAAEGRGEFNKFTRDGNSRARELFQAAHDADPNWAPPLAGLAATYWNTARFGWGTSKEEDVRIGIGLAERATALQPDDSSGFQVLANLYIESGRHVEGIALWEKAFAMTPTDLKAIQGLAWNLLWVGEEERALALYEDAKRLAPSPPWGLLAAEGLTLHFAGQHEAAVQSLIQATKRTDHPIPHSRLAAVYADLGQLEDARREVEWILARQPAAAIEDFTRIFRFPDPKRTDWYAGLLENAGLPHRQTEASLHQD